MNILFMSLGTFYNLNDSSVHLDLLKVLAKSNNVWLACKNEGLPTTMSVENGINVLRVHTGEQKRVGLIKKGVNTVLLAPQFYKAIKNHLSFVKFDLVLYTTPPITFTRAIEYIKQRDNAVTYLMLKDIFPQNAVDIGLMSKSGPKGLLWKWFRAQEIQLYKVSDYIGCMSQANVDFIRNHNRYIDSKRIGICPNSIIPVDRSCNAATRHMIREKYGIPQDKTVFVYGGNLGRPQDIPFIIDCLRNEITNTQAFFLIVGNGTEYKKIESFLNNYSSENAKLLPHLSKIDYDTLVGACDVGLIFLDHRFTIPNFPSRILSYMQAKIPVLCATDPNTDVGKVAEDGGFGMACSSASIVSFSDAIDKLLDSDLKAMGLAGWEYLKAHYNAHDTARSIISTVEALRSNR